MYEKLFLICLFFNVSVLVLPTEIYAQNKSRENKKSSKIQPRPTPKKEINIAPLSKIENEIFEEINFARTKPVEYAKKLQELSKYYKGNNFTLPGRKTFITLEGINSLNEAIEELKNLKPLEPLTVNCSAVRASRDHFADLQKSGAFSHLGSDGSSPQERLKKYIEGIVFSSENLVGRSGTARDILMMMLLDDGLPQRPHRKNILDSRFKFAGISNGNNVKNLNISVIVFSDSAADKEPCKMK